MMKPAPLRILIAMPFTATALEASAAAAPVAPATPSAQEGDMAMLGLTGVLGNTLILILVIVLAALAGLFVYRMIKRKDTPANAPFSGLDKPPTAGATPEIRTHVPSAAFEPSQQVHAGPTLADLPSDFDSALFLDHAKRCFVRMQAAWDKADTADLRQFTTPQVYAELKQQIEQGGQSGAQTEVVKLDAELLAIEPVGDDDLATVRFNGLIKPAPSAPVASFAEVWNMCRPRNGKSGWMLAGIQQLS